MAKKYYWLKLQKDFFKRHDIRIIEEMPNGKDYILFYMKLLVESISHEGNLRFSSTIPYNESMLSTITNTNVDIVRSAVQIFNELGLMEYMDDGTLYMNETQQMIGSETDWAKKKRDYRASEGQKRTLSDKSKSLELEKELDIEKDNKPKKTKPKKHKHGEYKNVLLSDEEFTKLTDEWGEKETTRMITSLSEGKELKGYSYKSDYLALRKWREKDNLAITDNNKVSATCPAPDHYTPLSQEDREEVKEMFAEQGATGICDLVMKNIRDK